MSTADGCRRQLPARVEASSLPWVSGVPTGKPGILILFSEKAIKSRVRACLCYLGTHRPTWGWPDTQVAQLVAPVVQICEQLPGLLQILPICGKGGLLGKHTCLQLVT